MNAFLQSRPHLQALLGFGVSPQDTPLHGVVKELGDALQMQCELLTLDDLDRDMFQNIENVIVSVASIRSILQKVLKEHQQHYHAQQKGGA